MALRPFRSTATEVLALSKADKLSATIVNSIGKKVGLSESRSWEASLPELAKVLAKAGLREVSMLIECTLPESSRRIDVILAGTHPVTGADNFVVVELKQWSHAELGWNSDRIVWSLHMRGDQLHPVEQVRGYCKYLQQYIAVLHEAPKILHGVAFLHNAKKAYVEPLFELPPDQLGCLFTGDQREDFIEYLQRQFASMPGTSAADRLLASPIQRRTTFLRSTLANHRNAAAESLVDNQRLAFAAVMNRIGIAHGADHKCVVLVTGGPGSGKSMVAMSLLLALLNDNRRVEYATGSEAITKTMRRIYGKQEPELRKLITYYKHLADVKKNDLDVLISDESHRIRRTSTDRFTKRDRQALKRPQIDELMAAARVPVFFLDENQIVRPDEVGSVDLIRDHAARAGFPVFEIKLDGQFRCGGSAAYDEWVRNLLGLRAAWPTPWRGDDDFVVRVATSPQQMEDFLREKINEGATARITAGYCWPWTPQPQSDGSLVHDVKIGDWSKPWNKYEDKLLGDAPPSWLWAYDDRGFEQVGCIYTAQGFEYDWAGVILGRDIVVDDQRLVVQRSANQDKALKGKYLFDEDFEILIRNTYKVLLTRGMRGVVIYADDPATQEFITSLVAPLASP